MERTHLSYRREPTECTFTKKVIACLLAQWTELAEAVEQQFVFENDNECLVWSLLTRNDLALGARLEVCKYVRVAWSGSHHLAGSYNCPPNGLQALRTYEEIVIDVSTFEVGLDTSDTNHLESGDAERIASEIIQRLVPSPWS